MGGGGVQTVLFMLIHNYGELQATQLHALCLLQTALERPLSQRANRQSSPLRGMLLSTTVRLLST